jgi:cyclophilin family peptidyl-prolyl cis-trans isomerase
MKLNRKNVLTIFVLFLFSGSIIIQVANFFLSPEDIAVLETNKGTIEIELYHERAPKTVENFKIYLEEGFYEGLVFHRVVENFVIQGGGYYKNATYKEATHDPIINEANNGLRNEKGAVAMARTSDPNSANTQFFINTVDNRGLDYPNPDGYGYAVFGKVIKGMDIVYMIEATPTGDKNSTLGVLQDWPLEDVIIKKAYLKDG